MTSRSPRDVPLRLQAWSKAASLATLLVGVMVLLGWWLDIGALKSVGLGLTTMKANTALGFVAAGIALMLLQTHPADRRRLMVAGVCSGLVTTVGALTLVEYVLGWELGIDQLLAREAASPGLANPGRMAPGAAGSFLLLGIALLLLMTMRRHRLAQLLTLLTILWALIAIMGYLYDARSLYQFASYSSVALPTAITILVLGVGLLFARPDQGWTAILSSDGAGGILARRVLPAAVALPILLGWLRLLGQTAGLYGLHFGVALFAASIIVVFTVLIALSAASLYRIDVARQNAENEINRMNLELEVRVLERTTKLTNANAQLETEVAERYLAEQELQALMDNIPDTIYFKDAAARFTRINAAQARVLGVSGPEDAIGKTDADFQPAHLAAGFHAEEQQLLRSGQPVVDRQEFNPTSDGQPRWFSATKVPVFDRQGFVTGLIGVSRDITRRIKAEDGLRQANAQLADRVKQLSVLNELEEQLQACLAVEEVYQIAAQWVSQLFPAESGALYITNSSRKRVETAAAWGTAPPESQPFELEDCWALRRVQPHVWRAGGTNLACRHVNDASAVLAVCIPLLAQGETLGVFHLRAGPEVDRHPFDEVQQQLARVAADSIALALANLRLRETLREQSIRDALTGLFNRRYMEESLERELQRAVRARRSVGIIMMDVDHFKRTNDIHGHGAGDAILRQLGRFLKDHTRGGDIACRYGGEEFALIFPEATLEQTRQRAEQLRQGFKATPLLHGDQAVGEVTLSFGVAAFPEHGETGEQILRAADAALYGAKRKGRDRVEVPESL